MIIGQTHKVDLANPVDYKPGTIYKYGTVVKSGGNLYVASSFIPAVDPGPGKSEMWEQVSEAPKISKAPTGFVDAVNDLGWDNTGEKPINFAVNATNIYVPAGIYKVAGSAGDFEYVNLLGETSAFTRMPLNRSEQTPTRWPLTMFYFEAGRQNLFFGLVDTRRTYKNIYFYGDKTSPIRNPANSFYSLTTFDNCHFNMKGMQYGFAYATTASHENIEFLHCSFEKSAGYDIIAGNAIPDSMPLTFYDCCVLSGSGLSTSGLGNKNAIWYNPILEVDKETKFEATIYNPTYI